MNIKKLLIFFLCLGASLPAHCMWQNVAKNFFNKKALFGTAIGAAGIGFGYTSANRVSDKADDIRLYILKQQKLKKIRENFPAYFKAFVTSPLLQKDVLTTDLETLRKIAEQCPEASVIFAQKFAKHLHKAVLTDEIPASKEHEQLARDIALKLQLNPTHTIMVYYHPHSISCCATATIDTEALDVDKTKYFIPYVHIIKLQDNFSNLSSNAQKFIVGHELMHAKLGHNLKKSHNMSCSRKLEKECDLGSAALGHEFAQGGIDWLSSMPRFYQNGELLHAVADSHDSHPSNHERIKYLKTFAKQNYPQKQIK